MTSSDTILAMILNRLDDIDGRIGGVENRIAASETTASESRRRMHERQENQGEVLIKIDHRVAAVEKAVDSAAPTLKEYAEMKAKVAGAGLLGRKLWKLGIAVIGGAVLLYNGRQHIADWWHWFITQR